MLGVSRQHVVNMADRGDLASVKVGAHRRIPSAEVDRLRGATRLTAGEEKSLRLHQALIGDLLADPDLVIGKARDNIARWLPEQRADGMTVSYLRQWQQILDGGVARIIDALTATDEQSRELRENSPFAGVLPPDKRTKILQTLRDLRGTATR